MQPPSFNARILKEIKTCSESTDFKFFIDKDGEFGDKNAFYIGFEAAGIYEGQWHVLRGAFGNHERVYPRDPPVMYFATPIFHANVGPTSGGICLDTLNQNWSSVYTLSTVFNFIIGLLDDPNGKSPMNAEAAKIKDNEELRRRAVEYYKSKIGDYGKLLAVVTDIDVDAYLAKVREM